MTDQSFSQKRVTEDFTCYVLFSEPLEAEFKEIIDAAAEDYPGLDWNCESFGPSHINTQSATLCVGSDPDCPGMLGALKIFGMPGRCDLDWEPLFHTNRLTFPFAREVIAQHTDHLSIHVASAEADGTATSQIVSRFQAARRLSCLVAVFAKLPTCVAVYFPNGDTIHPPERWVTAADTAMKGEFPLTTWIAMPFRVFNEPPELLPVQVSTIGMAAFNGHEIYLPRSRLPFPDACAYVLSATAMLLQAGHVFQDSDTMGMEGKGVQFRIRFAAEGKTYATRLGDIRPQTDQWWLFHDSCDLDHIDIFGAVSRPPPAPGEDNSFAGAPNSLRAGLKRLFGGK